MHHYLKNALRDIIARQDRPDIHRADPDRAEAIARAARLLLLHDDDNDTVERWIDRHDEDETTAAENRAALQAAAQHVLGRPKVKP